MFIQVIEKTRYRIPEKGNPPSFYLEKDDWNDFGYYTTYGLHVSGKHSRDGKVFYIGAVKILKKAQQEGRKEQLDLGGLDHLDEDYCSMSISLDYYERLNQLEEDLRDRLLIALRDLIIYPAFKEGFEGEEGFRKSLMRDISPDDDLFEFASVLISRNFESYIDKELAFRFKIPECDQPFSFDFSAPKYGEYEREELPSNIFVLIGSNGSGKSMLLSRIARIAFASVADRKDATLKQVGEITPKGIGFTRILLLSYSAFDAFQVPGIYYDEKKSIFTEMTQGLGRFTFCGVRDIAKELELTLRDLNTDESGKLLPEDILNDRSPNTIIKSLKDIEDEVMSNLSIIREVERGKLFQQAVEISSREIHSQFKDLLDEYTLFDDIGSIRELYNRLSTGHKFVFHALSSIVAKTSKKSLLLFDEPETHLHPPLLAGMMKAIRFILRKLDSFMIIATHSPIILQESLARHVYILRREGKLNSMRSPEIETFGENTGILTAMVFGLTADDSDFHRELDTVVTEITAQFPGSDLDSLMDQIESLFPRGMSMQARSYVLTKLHSKRS